MDAWMTCVRGLVFLLLGIVTLTSQALALDPPLQQLVEWETQANDAGARSPESFPLEHYEIPLELLRTDLASYLPEELRNELIFERDGKSFVRWVINPEDQKWHLEVMAFLRNQKLPADRHQYFTGYRTASRTMVAESPRGTQFFIKVSTNRTGGLWQDKKFSYYDGLADRAISDFVQERIAAKGAFKEFDPLLDVALFGIEALDQGLLVRSIGGLKEGDRFYIPGFSALSSKVGAEIAAKNGSQDPAAFWKKHYAEPLGRALAEYNFKIGLYHTSPHSQNFMIELDREMRPTGRVILRDFGDATFYRPYLALNGNESLIRRAEERLNEIEGNFYVSIGFMHGNSAPPWLDQEKKVQMDLAFFEQYDQTLSALTGIPIKELAVIPINFSSYATKAYRATIIESIFSRCELLRLKAM